MGARSLHGGIEWLMSRFNHPSKVEKFGIRKGKVGLGFANSTGDGDVIGKTPIQQLLLHEVCSIFQLETA